MTSLSLLLWICAAILFQIAIFLGIGFWRHWQKYQALSSGAAEVFQADVVDGQSDVEDLYVAAWQGYRAFRVDHRVIEDAVQSVCSFYLVPEDGQALPSFLPGQFLTFRLDLPTEAGGSEQIIRCYSLSDAPSSDRYRVSIKRVPAPSGSLVPPGRSSTYFHDQVGVGDLLQVRAPAGHFHIDRSTAPVVLIGGGIGITPMLSMVNWCLTEQPEREIWLFYGVRHGQELVMQAHLETLATAHSNFHLRLCFSNPLPESSADSAFNYHGRIDVALLRKELPLKPYHFYICGPTPMLESLVPGLEDWGVPESRIHFEAFGPASIKRKKSPAIQHSEAHGPTAEDGIVVTFAQSGKQIPWQSSSGSLLDFAEANGISVSSGCRAGGCGSCQTTIRQGEVAYLQPPEFDPEPGSCLLCVCTPKSSVTLEA
jgi:ferredoxin-NADP reductase